MGEMTGDEEWKSVFAAALEVASEPGVILIGGVGVYLHIANLIGVEDKAVNWVEFSHDVDAYASLESFADLRDIYAITANKRLSKHQAMVRGEEVDLYVERNNGLSIPYDEIAARAAEYGDAKVACLEHLLILKLDAAIDRAGTPKGEKDERDVIKIVSMMEGRAMPEILAPYMSDERMGMLRKVEKSAAFSVLARGNALSAKRLRQSYSDVVKVIGGQPPRWKPGR